MYHKLFGCRLWINKVEELANWSKYHDFKTTQRKSLKYCQKSWFRLVVSSNANSKANTASKSISNIQPQNNDDNSRSRKSSIKIKLIAENQCTHNRINNRWNALVQASKNWVLN